MKSAIAIFRRMAVAALMCAAPCAVAQVSLQLNEPPSNNTLDGIYVGAYSATNTQTGAPTQVICDDFMDNSDYQQETYTVNNFSDLGNTLWGQKLGVTNATPLYDEAAWLALQMVGLTGKEQGYYSYAIWAVFDPTDVANWLIGHNDTAACTAIFGNTTCTGSGGLLGSAKGESPSAAQLAEILILTPQGCGSPGACKEQEFFQIAEGGTAAMYLLLAAASCLGAMFFRSRRQNARVGIA